MTYRGNIQNINYKNIFWIFSGWRQIINKNH